MENKEIFKILYLIVGTICLLLLGVLSNSIIRNEPMSEGGKQIIGSIILALVAFAGVLIGKLKQ